MKTRDWNLFAVFVVLLTFAGFGAITEITTLNGTQSYNVGSGTNAWAFATNGARGDFGTGASDYIASDGTNLTTPAYVISGTPFPLDFVFVGAATVAGTIYGGTALPAKAFTVTESRFRISVAGSGGSTNAVFRITDGSNNCDCAFACNVAGGNKDIACTGNCAFAASASLTESMNSIGNCAIGPTILGNVGVWGNWQ